MNATIHHPIPHTIVNNGWIQTLQGLKIYPADPKPEQIVIGDIAGALSKMCRYNGHCKLFYSVAEHCVLVASKVSDTYKLEALMHDASEAYIADIARPVKPLLTNYGEIEDRLMRVIAAKYDFNWPLPSEVKDLDTAILRDEREQIMTPMMVPPSAWGDTREGLGVEIKFWEPCKAEYEFLTAFYRYGGKN